MLRVLSPGPLATIQDLGREGLQHWGVPIAGAMDAAAYQIANRLAGNSPDAACIEITAGGAAFEALEACALAVTGADLGATLNNLPLPLWMSVFVRAGQRIAFEGRSGHGARAYLALAGGVDVPLVLGSRSTYLPGGFGGLAGRALREGDILMTQNARRKTDVARIAGRLWPLPPDYEPAIRILPGPHAEWFDLGVLNAQPWRVSATSNRIGLRLDGTRLAQHTSRDLVSFGVFPGVIQIPPDGQLILLMADAQPTGGYPVIAVAIRADLHRAAQLLPGDALRFAWTTQAEAVAAWHDLRMRVEQLIEDDDGMFLAANTSS